MRRIKYKLYNTFYLFFSVQILIIYWLIFISGQREKYTKVFDNNNESIKNCASFK